MDIEVPFSEITPAYFGNDDDRIAPIDPDDIKEIGLILYDKKSGPFEMDIDYVDTY